MRYNTINPGPALWCANALCLIGLMLTVPRFALSAADETVTGAGQTPVELLVSVISGKEMAAERRRSNNLPAPDSSTRVYQTQSRNEIRQVRVLEGHSAYISHSQSMPYPTVISGDGPYGERAPYFNVEYRELEQGFAVRPRFEGGQLLLDISAANERWSDDGGGIVDNTVIQTTIRAELGQWVRLGGAHDPRADEVRGTRRTLSTGAREEDEIWVRVETSQ